MSGAIGGFTVGVGGIGGPSQMLALGARVLRKLGIAIVADYNRPGEAATLTSADVAALVLRDLGVPVAEGARPAALGTVSQALLAQRALRAVGVNPIGGLADPTPVISVTEIGVRALRMLGINPFTPLQTDPGSGATYTLAAIATAALLRLAVIAADETPWANDQAYALARAMAVHDVLVTGDLVNWPNTAIPSSAFEFYVIMTANLIAPGFGKPANPQEVAGAQAAIKQMALSGANGQTRVEAWVQTVHDRVASEALADWAVTAIPDAVGPMYVAMTVALVSSGFDKPADPKAWDAALADIRRIVLSGTRGQAIAMDLVAEVHEVLNASGLVSWAITAVPMAVAQAYVDMAAVLLGPVVGYQQDPPSRAADKVLWDAGMAFVHRASVISGALLRCQLEVQTVQSELNDLGLITWDAEHIPSSVSDAIEAMTMQRMGEEFGKEFDQKAYDAGMARIRQVSMGGPAGQALAVEKVMAVHYRLEAQGRVRWSIYDIPSWGQEPYVLLAATLLGSEFGMKVDPSWAPMAEMELMRGVSLPSDLDIVRAVYF